MAAIMSERLTYPLLRPRQLPEQRWTFGSILVYAPDQFHARQAREEVLKNGLPEAFGTIALEDGMKVRWVDLSRK
jgi:hypothetical protein